MTSPNVHSGGYSPEDLSGANVVDAEGNKVGAVQKVYRDDTTGEPEWVTVRTGLFGTKETFVPLAGATRTDNGLRVPHDKDVIKDAPRIDVDGHLDRSEEGTLYQHYGLTGPGDARRGTQTTGRHAAGVGGTAAGMAASDGPGHRTETSSMASGRTQSNVRPLAGTGAAGGGRAMAGAGAPTRGGPDLDLHGRTDRGAMDEKGQTEELLISEERLNIATEEHESGRAQLRKRVVTEDVTHQVQVSHEEVRVTRVPITEDERRSGHTDAHIGEGKVEVVLHEERAVLSKETVPVERVRMEVYKVTEEQEVSGQVRKEQIEFDEGNRAKHARGQDDLGDPWGKR
ncbi:PRC and DUF2382 domain-containing protein [Streptomyces sp. NPDC058657]|uniref:PRC and DUF2382 domain-containing protein n=1 Tax=unclassified Streptomyces TaxID=2593676 RepID=UPI003660ABB1